MKHTRLEYFLLLAALGGYYLASGEWISWLLLLAALGLPILSLLLSIPAIRHFELSAGGIAAARMGEAAELWLVGSCPEPMPPFRGSIRLKNGFTGRTAPYRPEKGLPTANCGCLTASVEKARVCDYLGLFSFRVRKPRESRILIRPTPVPIPDFVPPESTGALGWKPKHGGFSENHELRPYRPGDNLREVHWKLSAKTGTLIVREPMEPVRNTILLTLTLSGTPEELDRKLGRLLWLGNRLCADGTDFEIHCLTADGVLCRKVSGEKELLLTLDTLLTSTPAADEAMQSPAFASGWVYPIGGQSDEV